MRHLRILLALLIAIGTAPLASAQASKTPGATQAAVQANNAFACDLLQQLGKATPGSNVFFSPWSISSALAMTMEGARDQTALEMGQVLRLPKDLRQPGNRPWNLEPYHTGFADLQRRCTGPRDAVKDKETRAKIASLRKELADLNKKLQQKGGERDFKLQVKAHEVATTINNLQQQIDLFELTVANAIWGEKTYPFDQDFVNAVNRYYGSGLLQQADFIHQFPAERQRINRWVEEQTKERIKDLVPMLEPSVARRVRMILVNAIYFKGQWLDPFDKKMTKPEPFFLSDGGKVQTPLMHKTLQARYGAFQADGTPFATPHFIPFNEKPKTYPDGNGFLITEIPYKGNKLSMVVIAPQDPKGLPALQAKLTGAMLTGLLSKMENRQVRVVLPKFKLETEYELTAALQKMGMVQAFQEQTANFKGMSKSSLPDDNLSIGKVVHKAFVEVNEEGTEAAAATAVIMVTPTSAPPPGQRFTPEFRGDRPLLFLIREIESGAILFFGRINSPKA